MIRTPDSWCLAAHPAESGCCAHSGDGVYSGCHRGGGGLRLSARVGAQRCAARALLGYSANQWRQHRSGKCLCLACSQPGAKKKVQTKRRKTESVAPASSQPANGNVDHAALAAAGTSAEESAGPQLPGSPLVEMSALSQLVAYYNSASSESDDE